MQEGKSVSVVDIVLPHHGHDSQNAIAVESASFFAFHVEKRLAQALIGRYRLPYMRYRWGINWGGTFVNDRHVSAQFVQQGSSLILDKRPIRVLIQSSFSRKSAKGLHVKVLRRNGLQW